jgi:hypothetical protein
MTMTTSASDEVARYVADVAARLERLDPDERAELLADLEQHLLEVAAEEGAPLHERLGPPDAYAADLLASVGFEPSPPPRGLTLTRLVGRARQVQSSTAYRSTTAYLHTLRPAWWLFRGFVLAWLVADLLGADPLRVNVLLLPEIGPTLLPGLLLLAGSVAASVQVGRHAPPSGTWRSLVTVANVGLFLFALSLAGQVQQRIYSGPVMVYSTPPGQCLVNGDGTTIDNLYPYDAEGRPLGPVLLYDQDGRPLDNLCPTLPTEYARDVNGGIVVNAFPRHQSAHPTDESPLSPPRAPPAIVPPRLAPSTTTTTTTTTVPPSTTTTMAPPS